MKIDDVMTPCPHNIDASASLDEAIKKMSLLGVRHLPVVENGTLLGVVSERDLNLSQFVCRTTSYCPCVGDVCVGEVFSVPSGSEVAMVALEMAEKKREYALVSDKDDNVIGIFTTVDACRLVHRTLKGKS